MAPTFLFLAGTGAYLHGQSLGDRRAAARFLVTRGLWLVLLELTVIRVAWTFNLDFSHYLLAGVIWMIGWCMVLMAGVIFLPMRAIAGVGIAIIALHNITDFFPVENPGWLLQVLYYGGVVHIGASGPPLYVLFVIVPWIAVMMVGYAFGPVMTMTVERRRTLCLRLGLLLSALFVVLRVLGVYGDPRPWATLTQHLPSALAFLATNKYPASLEFLLMTLGPMFVALALVETWRGRFADVVSTFGRVPFFYYVLHIPTIHLAACIVSVVREGHIDPWLFGNHPMAPGPAPDGYMWSLPLLYLVFFICVTALYLPCRWYARVKETRRSALLSYL